MSEWGKPSREQSTWWGLSTRSHELVRVPIDAWMKGVVARTKETRSLSKPLYSLRLVEVSRPCRSTPFLIIANPANFSRRIPDPLTDSFGRPHPDRPGNRTRNLVNRKACNIPLYHTGSSGSDGIDQLTQDHKCRIKNVSEKNSPFIRVQRRTTQVGWRKANQRKKIMNYFNHDAEPVGKTLSHEETKTKRDPTPPKKNFLWCNIILRIITQWNIRLEKVKKNLKKIKKQKLFSRNERFFCFGLPMTKKKIK